MLFRNPKGRVSLLVVAAGALTLGLLSVWWLCYRNPEINFLPPRTPAQWIVYPTPPAAQALRKVELATEFRRSFQLDKNVSPATISICAFKKWTIRVNGQPLPGPNAPPENWKQVAAVDVSGLFKPGANNLSVEVSNSEGLPCLWLSLRAGGFVLNSDESWQGSFVGGTWSAAHLAEEPIPIEKGSPLWSPESPCRSMVERLPIFLIYLALASAVLAGTHWWKVRRKNTVNQSLLIPVEVCLWTGLGVLILAWVLLWWHDAGELLRLAGFDTAGHLAYIQYLLDKHGLPLADEGWEMFQPPLYYLLSAAQLGLLHLSTSEPSGILILRFFGMSCGLLTFVMAFLSVRQLFPDEPSTQFFGLLLSALLPVNLYLCFYPTNENLTAALAAVSVYLGLRILADPRVRVLPHALLGLLLGAACLTKASALMVCPILLVALGWNLRAKHVHRRLPWVLCLGATILVCAAVCGWHYWRVASHFGNPLIGNWNVETGFSWWQQPGFRIGSYYLHFGQSLAHPFYSAFASMGDGLYSTLWGDGLCGGQPDIAVRPPWNYELMSAGYLLALLPMLALLTGGALTLLRFCQRPRPEGFVLLGITAISGAALFYYSLRIPVYASAKAFYASSAFVPLCVLAATGWSSLNRKIGRFTWLLWLPMLVWAFNVYASFWIHRDAPSTRLPVARVLASDGFLDRAMEQLSQVLARDPSNSAAAQLRARILAHQDRLPEAREQAEKALASDPKDAGAHLALGNILAQQGPIDQALEQAKQALELAPGHPLAASRLSVWLFEAGKKAEAKAACAESLRVNPFSSEFNYRMAVICAALGDQTNAAVYGRLASELKRTDLRAR
jgi:tetratricopeptide (TPR) repeat protein